MINFELHLTTNKIFITHLDGFIKTCHLLSTKPLSIKLEHNLNCEQVTTIAYFNCETKHAIPLVKEFKKQLNTLDFPIERLKMEAPFDALPLSAKITENNTGYLEWHGETYVHNQADLLDLCKSTHTELLFCNNPENESILGTISIRHPLDDKSEFCDYIKQFIGELNMNGYSLLSQQFKHCLYDDYNQH